MGKVIAGMTASLDGFINDSNGSIDKLYADFEELHKVEETTAMRTSVVFRVVKK